MSSCNALLTPAAIGDEAAAVDLIESASATTIEALKQRNTALDWAFYDVAGLTSAEFSWLVTETAIQGSILVVWPAGARGNLGVHKFEDHGELRASPGKTLERFAIAGVGSSDVGAAAFARTLANRYQEPVGAIVAGYGVADMLAEAAGGWFFLGGANRLLKAYHDVAALEPVSESEVSAAAEAAHAPHPHAAAGAVIGRNDAETLLKLLLDEDRVVKSVAGHSKGALSIAFALEGLALSAQEEAIARAKAARVVTAGAVVELPRGFENVGQYLGALDWFGGLNSRPGVDFTPVPNAWHHLNTSIPFCLDFARVLSGEPD